MPRIAAGCYTEGQPELRGNMGCLVGNDRVSTNEMSTYYLADICTFT
jgi:hypothetical protein